MFSECFIRNMGALARGGWLVALFLLPFSAWGWGPHPAITQAALDTLGTYQPRQLGTNDATAVEGLLRRMDELIEFPKLRGQRLRVLVETGNRTATEPVVLESALETSRVTADLLHTLGQLLGSAASAQT